MDQEPGVMHDGDGENVEDEISKEDDGPMFVISQTFSIIGNNDIEQPCELPIIKEEDGDLSTMSKPADVSVEQIQCSPNTNEDLSDESVTVKEEEELSDHITDISDVDTKTKSILRSQKHRNCHHETEVHKRALDKDSGDETELVSSLEQHRELISNLKEECKGLDYCPCTVCGKDFASSSALTRHVWYHFSGKQCSCPTCGREFSRAGSLKQHMLTHNETKAYRCIVCGKCFSQAPSFYRHKATHKTDAAEKYKTCHTCGKIVTSVEGLRKHMVMHTGEREHECTACGKSFARSGDLKSHSYTHSDSKEFQCSICDKRFANPNGLRYHMKVHNPEKKHSCLACDKREALRQHVLSNCGQKAYYCSLCAEVFTSLASLRKHEKNCDIGEDTEARRFTNNCVKIDLQN